MGQLKVLISAFACRPNEGSEPGKGWACALETARKHEVWVLTRGKYRGLIEEELARNPVENLHFVYFDAPRWTWSKKRKPGFFQFTYYAWQLGAYFCARPICRKHKIDVIHHVSYSKFWAPCFVSLLPVPFVWGPVGGGEKTPAGFWDNYSLRGKIYEILRDTATWLGECDPFVKLTARRSAVAFATTNESAERMRRLGAKDVEVFPAIGMKQGDIDHIDRVVGSSPAGCRFASIGRMLHWKGFDLGLEAFARANIPDSEYWFVGEGPELARLKAFAESLGVTDRVKFLGKMNHDATLEKLGACHVLVHPSLHESGGLVCLESMAARRPVLCLDLGGPAVQVPDDAGIKVPAAGREQTIRDMAAAMRKLAADPPLREAMGNAGRRRIESQYLWKHKAAFYESAYARALRTDEPGRLAASQPQA